MPRFAIAAQPRRVSKAPSPLIVPIRWPGEICPNRWGTLNFPVCSSRWYLPARCRLCPAAPAQMSPSPYGVDAGAMCRVCVLLHPFDGLARLHCSHGHLTRRETQSSTPCASGQGRPRGLAPIRKLREFGARHLGGLYRDSLAAGSGGAIRGGSASRTVDGLPAEGHWRSGRSSTGCSRHSALLGFPAPVADSCPICRRDTWTGPSPSDMWGSPACANGLPIHPGRRPVANMYRAEWGIRG